MCLAVLVVGIGGYGIYDLLMAPEALAKGAGQHANGRPRRSSSGFLTTVMGGRGVELCPGQEQVNIVLLGTDEFRHGGRADTIMLVMIRKDTKRAAAISVPRDLMVRMPGYGIQKINAIYAFNKRKGTGEITTARTVAQILGVHVDYYIKTDVTKLPALFDAFGGLDLYVDRNMYWNDSRTDLHINLRKGQQHLNGKQIEGFVRHRRDHRYGDSSDHDRSQRQQYVLKELIKQKGNLTTATKLPQIVHALRDMIRTDMSAPELVALGLLAKQVDTSQVISRVVPSHARMSGAWYAVLEPERTTRMMAEVQAALAGGPIPPDSSRERNERIGGGS